MYLLPDWGVPNLLRSLAEQGENAKKATYRDCGGILTLYPSPWMVLAGCEGDSVLLDGKNK